MDSVFLKKSFIVLSFSILKANANIAKAQCAGNDCVLLTGQYFVDITVDTANFKPLCEYRWRVTDTAAQNGSMFYPTVVSADALNVQWGGDIVMYVHKSDKGTALGTYGSLTARTFERCPNEVPQ